MKVWLIWPGPKVSTPLVVRYLNPGSAVPATVLKFTWIVPDRPLVRRTVTGRKPAPSLTT